MISNWLKRRTQRGLSLAAEYAKAGYDMALERADQAWSARALLDSGTPAQEAPVHSKPRIYKDKALDRWRTWAI